MKRNGGYSPSDPLWYKDAIFYELRVRSFYDSNGDGIGDFAGLTAKLDYLYKLGVTTLWLLPFFPSPLRDDGYDISDYTNVHPDYGTLADFRKFLREAHARNLHVVIELVLNHTSSQHEWFQRARNSPPGSNFRNYYIWSDDPERYKDARIIFQDFEPSNWSWDHAAKAYYFHRFYSHQPDLNYDNPAVRREMLRIVDFWLGLGVDGLRLDAVPYLYKREGTNCENLPETHAFLVQLRRHIDDNFFGRMLLAEANQWPEDAAAYFDEGRECQMAFHFPLMPRMFLAVRMEERFPMVDIWSQTPPIPETCQWALFLRNHDELTLEMVSEEERDYMYRAFAKEPRMLLNLGIRRRLAPLLGNNRRAIELNNALLLSLPGTPVIYYGDEIGMGDNLSLGDRDGVRTPMQWNGDRNAGFSTANPQHLVLPLVIDYEYHYQAVNVEAQEANPHSLMWWMRRLIALRRQFKAFGRGSIDFLNPENPHVLAFVRRYQDERILVVANLSRFVQYVELDLSEYQGMVPVELFGRNQFPTVSERPYLLTLGPHGFFYFSLEKRHAQAQVEQRPYQPPRLELAGTLESLLRGYNRSALEQVLPDYLPRCRWFRAKSRSIRTVTVGDALEINESGGDAFLVLLNVSYRNAEAETYVLALALASGEQAAHIRAHYPERIIAASYRADRNGASEGVLYDALAQPEFGRALLAMIERPRRVRGLSGELQTSPTHILRELRGARNEVLEVRAVKAEQSNTSLIFGDRLILKVYRRLDAGINPDVEISRFLTEHTPFNNIPRLAGWIDFHNNKGEVRTAAILQEYVANQGDAWEFTSSELKRYFEVTAASGQPPALPEQRFMALLDQEQPDPVAAQYVGAYLQAASLMGQRIAELHLALLNSSDVPAFAPEPYSALYQRSVFQSMSNLLSQAVRQLRSKLTILDDKIRPRVEAIVASQSQIAAKFSAFARRKITVARLRCHGDLHLGQLLYTGKDFVIIDFEGEPARPLSERRHKSTALRDVAGMLRSFQYAALSAAIEQQHIGPKSDPGVTEGWARLWQIWSCWAFLRSYMQTAGSGPLIPADREELRILLEAFVMEKAVYELGYELNNRPEWLSIPLLGISEILGLPIASALASDTSPTA